MAIRFDGRVAVVTGGGNGLGRDHCLRLAERGARVVVNDLGTSVAGEGASPAAADAVVAEIHAAGGEAIAPTTTALRHVRVVRRSSLQLWRRLVVSTS